MKQFNKSKTTRSSISSLGNRFAQSGRSMLEVIAVIILLALLLIAGLYGFRQAVLNSRVNTMSKDLATAITDRRYLNAQGGAGKEHKSDKKVGNTDVHVENQVSDGSFVVSIKNIKADECEEMKKFNIFQPTRIGANKFDDKNPNKITPIKDIAGLDCAQVSALDFYYDNYGSESAGGSSLGNDCDGVKTKKYCNITEPGYDSHGCLIKEPFACPSGQYCKDSGTECESCPTDDSEPPYNLCKDKSWSSKEDIPADCPNKNVKKWKVSPKTDGTSCGTCGTCLGGVCTNEGKKAKGSACTTSDCCQDGLTCTGGICKDSTACTFGTKEYTNGAKVEDCGKCSSGTVVEDTSKYNTSCQTCNTNTWKVSNKTGSCGTCGTCLGGECTNEGKKAKGGVCTTNDCCQDGLTCDNNKCRDLHSCKLKLGLVYLEYDNGEKVGSCGKCSNGTIVEDTSAYNSSCQTCTSIWTLSNKEGPCGTCGTCSDGECKNDHNKYKYDGNYLVNGVCTSINESRCDTLSSCTPTSSTACTFGTKEYTNGAKVGDCGKCSNKTVVEDTSSYNTSCQTCNTSTWKVSNKTGSCGTCGTCSNGVCTNEGKKAKGSACTTSDCCQDGLTCTGGICKDSTACTFGTKEYTNGAKVEDCGKCSSGTVVEDTSKYNTSCQTCNTNTWKVSNKTGSCGTCGTCSNGSCNDPGEQTFSYKKLEGTTCKTGTINACSKPSDECGDCERIKEFGIALIVDHSGSMTSGGNAKKVDQALAKLKIYKDAYSMVYFHDTIGQKLSWGKHTMDEIRNAVYNYSNSGNTGFTKAFDYIESICTSDKKFIILWLTDGEVNVDKSKLTKFLKNRICSSVLYMVSTTSTDQKTYSANKWVSFANFGESTVEEFNQVSKEVGCFPVAQPETEVLGFGSCNAGSVYTLGKGCEECAVGTYASAGATSCTDCPKGHYCPKGSSAPTPCPSGKYRSSTKGSSESGCTTCADGKYSSAGATSCTDCPSGQKSNSTHTGCEGCAAGTYANGDSCSNCPAGSYCSGGTKATCPAGYYCPAKSSAPTPCPAGTYRSVTGGTGQVNCSTCANGTYSAAGATSCTNCPSGQASNSTHTGCEGCAAGTYYNSSTKKCADCPAGSYCSGGTKTTCGAGYYCPAKSSAATPCPAGTYRSATGGTSSSSCTTCANGTYSAAGATSCTNCLSGQQSNSTHTGCEGCAAGTYYNSSTKKCADCPAGSYCSGGTKTTCWAGYYCPAKSSAPTPCPDKTYRSSTGGSSCSKCSSCVSSDRTACNKKYC